MSMSIHHTWYIHTYMYHVFEKKAFFGKIGMTWMSGIQGEDMMVVLHHGEPCTFRPAKNIIFGNKKKMVSSPRF